MSYREKHSGQTPGMRQWVRFLAAAHQFPAENFKGKRGKQLVSRKIYKKLETLIEISKRKRKENGKLMTFQTQS